MWLVMFPTTCPAWFWVLAIGWSLFQGYTGRVYGLFICESARRGEVGQPSRLTREGAYGLHHASLYFVCSMSGFVAWSLANDLYQSVESWSSVGGGIGAVMIALAGFTVMGVSGALPRILYLGHKPT